VQRSVSICRTIAAIEITWGWATGPLMPVSTSDSLTVTLSATNGSTTYCDTTAERLSVLTLRHQLITHFSRQSRPITHSMSHPHTPHLSLQFFDHTAGIHPA
jgi:hypothetical protein